MAQTQQDTTDGQTPEADGPKDFGPTRRETQIYLTISCAGLALLAAAIGFRGVSGIMAIEVVGMAGLFFGGTAVWAVLRLRRLS